MANFTSGAWKTCKPEDSTGWVDIINDEGKAIITCWYGNNKNADANANLVKAAPEMYKALKYACEELCHPECNKKTCSDCEIEQALTKVKEATV